MKKFHGGCTTCTMQDKNGLSYCVGCRYFEADWSLPSKNDYELRENEELERFRNQAKAEYKNKYK